MTKTYTIKLNTVGGTTQAVELTAGQAQATVVAVTGRVNVELVDTSTGRAPQKLGVRRVGNDLQIVFEAGNPAEPDLVLQDFYGTNDNHLTGLAENGALFEYVPTSGNADAYLPLMPDGTGSAQVLGGLEMPAEKAATSFAPWVLGLVGLAAVAAVAGGGGGGHGGGGNGGGDIVVIPATPSQRPDGYLDNVGPTQSAISTAPLTDDNTPGLHIGALPPGATGAVLYVDGVLTASTYNPATGTLTPQTPLTDGQHTLGYGLSNPAGVTPSSPALQLTIDTQPPAAPVLHVADIDGDGRPDISGTGEPGGQVVITDPSGATHTTTVDPDGNFALEIDMPTTPLGEWQATVTDPAGNTSPPGRVLVTDLTAPAAPLVDGVHDNVGAILGLVPDHGDTDDATPTITGTAEPDTKVTLLDADGKPIGTTTTKADGTWAFTPETALPDGTYAITARATDGSGNTGLASAPAVFTIDTIAPAPATINSLTDDVGAITGQIVNGTVTDDSRPTIAGRAEHGNIVTIKDGSTVLGTTSVGETGYWTFTPTVALAEGSHAWTATVSDKAGNTSAATTPITFVVDVTPPGAATIGRVVDDQGPVTGNLVSSITTLTDDAQPAFSGTADADTTVVIKDGNLQIGTASVSSAGVWNFIPTSPLLNGVHHITAAAMDTAGNTGAASAAFEFKLIAGGVPTAPSITDVIADAGTVVNIVPNGLTNDPTPTVRGTAAPGSVVSVVNQPGTAGATGVVIGVGTAGADGQWSITLTTPLADGRHDLTATAADPKSGLDATTAVYPITIDTHAPDAATAQLLTDNVGTLTGTIAPGSTTDDATPTFTGKAEPGATVTVKDGANTLGTTRVQPDGTWAFTPTSPLVDGPHSLTTTVTDPARNVSPASAPITFDVDTRAVAVSIGRVTDDVGATTGPLAPGAFTDDLRPTVSGQALPGGIVKLFVDGVALPAATTTADSNGHWSITPATDLAQGQHLLTVTVTTTAGGESAPTAPFALTVDSLPPAVPALVSVTDNVGPVRGVLAIGAPSDDSTPELAGTAEADSIVTVLDAGHAIGTAKADATGKWTFTPAPPLNDGPHAISITATDAAGNVSAPSVARTLTIDTLAPAAPAIAAAEDDVGIYSGNIASGVSTDDTAPRLSGTAERDSVITILDGGKTIGTALTDGTGKWFFTTPVLVGQGAHLISITATDAAGNVSQPSGTWNVNIDTLAPAIPTITAAEDDAGVHTGNIASGVASNDTTPRLSGKAEADSLVTILDGTHPLGTARADGSGAWFFTPPALTDQGLHPITITATDAAGNVSRPSDVWNVNIDTLAPAAPTIAASEDDVGLLLGNIASGAPTDDTTPRLSGTAEPKSTIKIFDGANSIGTALADDNGQWFFTTPPLLAQGPHLITTTATDSAGNESPHSAAWTVNIDTSIPATPAIAGNEDNVGIYTGNIASGAATDDNTPTLAGTADPHSVVTILDGGTSIGTTTAGEDGKWAFTPAALAGEGPHSITITASNAAGGVSAPSQAWVVNIDTLAPGVPTIATATDNVGIHTGNIASGVATNDNTPTLSGTAEGNSLVTVMDGKLTIGTTTTDKDGNWTFTTLPLLAQGPHLITITATDAAGNVSLPSLPWNVNIDTLAPGTPAISANEDNVGLYTGNIANGAATDDTTPTLSGTAEADSTITIRDGSTDLGTASTNDKGVWFFTTPPLLAQGPHLITVIATDAAGNASQASTPWTINIQTVLPGVPTIAAAEDNVGLYTGNIASGVVTDDNTPRLSGTAEANSLINIIDGPANIGTARADGDGKWFFITPALTAQGLHAITVTATNAAGGVSPPSLPWNINIDTLPPATPSVDANEDNVGIHTGNIASGTFTDDTTPTLSGTAEAKSLVRIYDGLNEIGTTNANDSGKWFFTTPPLPGQGSHVITVSATDAAGNVSQRSPVWDVNIDTVVPDAPLIAASEDDVGLITGNIASGVITDDTTPRLSGTAEIDSLITIFDGGTNIGTARAGSDGKWFFTTPPLAGQGPHLITTTATDAAGNESVHSAAWTVNIDASTPATPTIATSADNVGIYTGNIASGIATDDNTPTLSGTADHDIALTIYDGARNIGTTTADKDGKWSFTTPALLVQGPHLITVVATNTAGAVSETSAAWTVNVDTQAPGTPAIAASEDDVALHTGNIASGVLTNDNTPKLSGTAEKDSLITIFDDNNNIGTARADGAGQWFFTTPALTAQGSHLLSITATDAAGNVSLRSVAWEVNIDTVAPTTRTITASNDNVALNTGDIASGTPTNDNTPTLSGTAEINSLVTLFDGVTSIATTTAGADGKWTITTPVLVGDRLHAMTITSTDDAGNASTSSAIWNVQLDTSAPVFTSAATASADENTALGTVIQTATATDASVITYSISGGADAAHFSIDAATGAVSLNFKPNYEAPIDSGGDNVYNYTIIATDAAGNQTSQNAVFTVRDIFELPDNMIINGSQPGVNWTIDRYGGNNFRGDLNSTLVSGLFGASSAPDNSSGALYMDGDVAGRLGSNIVAINEQLLTLTNGKSYDFSLDAIANTGPNSPLATNAIWVLVSATTNNIVKTFTDTGISTGGPGANAAYHLASNWTTFQTTFLSDIPTGDYRLALVWTPSAGPSGDMQFDRLYMAEHIAPTVPPVAFDLNHDSDISYINASINLSGDGTTHTTAWVGKDDGVLVWDKYHDGKVHDSSQYAFAQYLTGAKTDLEGLKAFDTNNDSQLDVNDVVWKEMNIWQDINQNGISDTGEVKTLADWGIASISLKSDGVASTPAEGVHEAGKTSATLKDGSQMVVADVSFDTKTTNLINTTTPQPSKTDLPATHPIAESLPPVIYLDPNQQHLVI